MSSVWQILCMFSDYMRERAIAFLAKNNIRAHADVYVIFNANYEAIEARAKLDNNPTTAGLIAFHVLTGVRYFSVGFVSFANMKHDITGAYLPDSGEVNMGIKWREFDETYMDFDYFYELAKALEEDIAIAAKLS